MALKKSQLASAVGPYIRADGSETKGLAYMELVKVLIPVNDKKEVYVEGLDSHNKVWILESSLVSFPNKEWTPNG